MTFMNGAVGLFLSVWDGVMGSLRAFNGAVLGVLYIPVSLHEGYPVNFMISRAKVLILVNIL